MARAPQPGVSLPLALAFASLGLVGALVGLALGLGVLRSTVRVPAAVADVSTVPEMDEPDAATATTDPAPVPVEPSEPGAPSQAVPRRKPFEVAAPNEVRETTTARPVAPAVEDPSTSDDRMASAWLRVIGSPVRAYVVSAEDPERQYELSSRFAALPVGAYEVWAAFAELPEHVALPHLELAEGVQYTLRCVEGMDLCRIDR